MRYKLSRVGGLDFIAFSIGGFENHGAIKGGHTAYVIVYAVVDDALSPDFPLGVELEVFIRREDAERFIDNVGGDDPELATYLRRGARA
jgi:hypothetical protein